MKFPENGFSKLPKKKEFEAQNRLRLIRFEQKRTLQAVADAIDTSAGQIHRLETGERSLDVEWMRKFAEFFKMPPADFLLPADGGLSRNERDIITAYRNLPEVAQYGIMAHLDGLKALLKK